MTRRRYPIEPLIALTGWTLHGEIRRLAPASGAELAKRRTDGVTEAIADRLAVAAGRHPWEIWPEMIDHAIGDLERPCDGCGVAMEAPDPRRRYCSKPCRMKAAQRRWRNTPGGREANRIACAKYRSENLDYERMRTRTGRSSPRAKNNDVDYKSAATSRPQQHRVPAQVAKGSPAAPTTSPPSAHDPDMDTEVA